MDLSNYESLKPCSSVEVYHQLRLARRRVELYVADLDPDLFEQLNLPSYFKANVAVSRDVLQLQDDEFLRLFHRVFYESLHIEINLKEEKKIKYLKGWCLVAITWFTVLFISLPLQREWKFALFVLIVLLCVGLNELFRHKVNLVVSDIKRRTHFKVMHDEYLLKLPALYIIDEEKMFIGANLLKRPCNMQLYSVEGEADQETLKSIYRHYIEEGIGVPDEVIIGQYFERMHSDELRDMSWQE